MRQITLITLVLLLSCTPAHPNEADSALNSSRDELIEKYGFEKIRSYQILNNTESITFNYLEGLDSATITFYLKDDIVEKFNINDREEMAKQYMSEFASGNILFNYPKVRIALLNALMKLPLEDYLEVTDRRRPIIFIDYYTGGIAQYAGSLEFSMRETDPPTFQDGFFIIRLGDGLNEADDPEAIEGIILHEIMHRKLEHLRAKDIHPCELEMEANQALKSLGFEGVFKKATETFGAKKKGDSPCSEYLKKKQNSDQ